MKLNLADGHVLLFDAEDEELVTQHNWHAVWTSRKLATPIWYAQTHLDRHHTAYLHRLLMQPGHGVVDHRNKNGLDNRRCNLRVTSQRLNVVRKHSTGRAGTGFRGIEPKRGRWQARIRDGERRRTIGVYDTPEEAARAYDAAACEINGEFAVLNFPGGHDAVLL